MVSDNNSKAEIHMLPYHSQRAFICILPRDIQNCPLRNKGQWLFILKRNLIIQEVRGLDTKSGHRSSDSDISHGHLWETPTAQVHRGFKPSHEKNRESEKSLRLGLPPPWASAPDTSGFWEKQCLATDIVRGHGPGDLMERQEGSPPERSGETGRTLPFSVPPFLLLPPCSALMLRTKEKNEVLGLILSVL